jgi:tetratricopeptide (TPR) repeat protein
VSPLGWAVPGLAMMALIALPAACQEPPGSASPLARADQLAARGRQAEAESLYRAELDGSHGLVARVRLGLLLEERGERREAFRLFEQAVRTANERRRLSSAEWAAVADGLRALGAEDPSRYREALRAYDLAIAADSSNLDARVAVGMLFLERHARPEAVETFNAILAGHPRHAPALLGLALVSLADGAPAAYALLARSLEADPDLVAARVALARTHLDREAWAEAEAEAARALEVNPASLPALTARAAARLFRGDTAGFEADRQAVFARHAGYAAFYADLAEVSARNRFYREAVAWAARGVALDSSSARTLGALGLNQLRVGEMAAGRRNLERAFALDPFNVWYKNTLDLLDVFARYTETSSPRFRLYTAPDDAGVLTPYLIPLAEEAYDRLAERYGYRPPTPIQVELYRHSADFSVRTVGLAGLGALGVSFGPVLAMDAPGARRRGEINWGSTFWHELAHTFTLGVTGHRVPRWVSEGLSVLEERRARPGWGAHARLGFLAAAVDGRLLPVSRLNDGFVRPSYPEQVGHAYYQASLVAEMIEETRGAGAIRAMLAAYREGHLTPEVFRRALHVEPEAFDAEFDRWIRNRFRGELAALQGEDGGPFRRTLRAAVEAVRAGRVDDAVPLLEQARELFPGYAEVDNPYAHLARIHEARGDLARAAREWGQLTALAETDYEANLEEARVRERLGDLAGAAAALERAVWIDPREPALHERLAGLHGRLGEWRKAVRARQAVLGLGPADRAEAHYRLARDWFEAGEREAARREVLRALDIAPAFQRAQELLLRIRGEG